MTNLEFFDLAEAFYFLEAKAERLGLFEKELKEIERALDKLCPLGKKKEEKER